MSLRSKVTPALPSLSRALARVATAVALALGGVSLAAIAGQSGPQGSEYYLGAWKGIITQELGPTTRYFDMEMSIAARQGTEGLFDVSCHVMDGDYHAYMSGQAQLTPAGELFVREDEIIRADSIPGMAWCLKRLELKRTMEKGVMHLRGRWEGDTYFGACPPGNMDLIRPVLRP